MMRKTGHFALTFLVIFISLAFPNGAYAHTSLLTQYPLGNSVIEVVPGEIELTFDEELMDFGGGNKVVVTAPNGSEISIGKTRVISSRVLRTLQSSTIAGKYKVEYRVVSADGHVVEGEYAFSLKVKGNVSSSAKASPVVSPSEISAPEDAPVTKTIPARESHSGVIGFVKHHLEHIYLTILAFALLGGWWILRRFGR